MADELPTHVFPEAWKRYRQWADHSKTLKRKQQHARSSALLLGLGAAVLATGSSIAALVWPELFPPTSTATSVATGISALMLVLAGAVGRELLIPQREQEWVRARIHAERLKRLLWLHTVSAAPYDDPKTKDAKLRDAVFVPIESALCAAPPPSSRTSAQKMEEQQRRDPLANPPDDPKAREKHYLDNRLAEQVGWYSREAASIQDQIASARKFVFALGLATIAAGSSGFVGTAVPAVVPLLTTLTAAILTHIRARGSAGLQALYTRVANELKLQHFVWRDVGPDERDIRVLAVACEAIMERENRSWEAEQLSDERLAEATKVLTQHTSPSPNLAAANAAPRADLLVRGPANEPPDAS